VSTGRGAASELAVRTLAAELGVRDFVYHPVTIGKGRARRELTDGLLVVGDRGAILHQGTRLNR
jgi:hypothetical protein